MIKPKAGRASFQWQICFAKYLQNMRYISHSKLKRLRCRPWQDKTLYDMIFLEKHFIFITWNVAIFKRHRESPGSPNSRFSPWYACTTTIQRPGLSLDGHSAFAGGGAYGNSLVQSMSGPQTS